MNELQIDELQINGLMNEIFKVVLSLSFSGSLLILALFICLRLLKNRLSQCWQYYIWLVPLARLLLPFAPEHNLFGILFQNQAEPNAIMPFWQTANYNAPSAVLDGQTLTSTAAMPGGQLNSAFILPDIAQYCWLIWLAVALALLVRKITAYQSFVRFVRAGKKPVEDMALLNRLAELTAEMRLQRPVDLAVNPLLSTPLLIGMRRPCIVFPSVELGAADFQYAVRHELSHCRRFDSLYKWLVQLAVCLHWFNPLVWLLGRRVNRACELACDEAVIRRLDTGGRQAYGDMLLRALALGGGYQENVPALKLQENTKLMKERLKLIMRFKRKSKIAVMFSLLLAALFVIGAATAGAYTIPKPALKMFNILTVPEINIPGINIPKIDIPEINVPKNMDKSYLEQQAAQDYEHDNVARLAMIFDELSSETQADYLNRAYADGNTAMFSVCLNNMTISDAQLTELAAKAYAEKNTAFFSMLAQEMDDKQLESWLERATADNKTTFRLMLLYESGRYDEWETLQAEEEAKRLAEYAQLGVSKNGGNYYYQGQQVRIFMDVYANDKSFVYMQTSPQGKVDIKITRDDDGTIISLDFLTEAERRQLFGDDGEEEKEDMEKGWPYEWEEDWADKWEEEFDDFWEDWEKDFDEFWEGKK